jgi:hypothetical protein
MELEDEAVAIDADEWGKLKRHGATQEEIAFLCNRRVELNAMTSPQERLTTHCDCISVR